MTYTLPSDVDERPVAIIGGGTLGRRIATALCAGGTDVRICDVSPDQRDACAAYVTENIDRMRQSLGVKSDRTGAAELTDDLQAAVQGAWLVIEAVPEKLELKRELFGELDRITDPDTILASNSSSLATSRMIDGLEHPDRVLNMHFQQPPELTAVELMSSGETRDGIIDALMARLRNYGLAPFHVRRESDGFIFNRIWAAIKREALMVVEEGVAAPEDVDGMWDIWVRPGIAPFALMDRVGLDVVLNIEEHYASIRPGIPDGPRKLLREYIEQGRLGVKTGRGFYEY